MPLNRIVAAGTILALVAAVFFIVVVASSPFPTSQLASQSGRFVSTGPGSDVGGEDSRFMWKNVDTALAGQALVIFAAAAGCLAILRVEEGSKPE
jgi:hypothetical protein